MNTPQRLLFCQIDSKNGEDTAIQALFLHNDQPILFNATLPSENREFYADIYSTNEETAEEFMPEDLLDACYCNGCMEPENKEHTDETRALMTQCVIGADENNLE